MKNRDMFREAIAEAKTIKETALANAKATLEESFAPYLKEKLAAKLAEMDEQEVNEAKDEVEEGLPNIDPGAEPKSQLRTKPDMAQLEEEDIDEEMDLDELLAELEKDMSESEDMDEAEEIDESYDMDEAEDIKEEEEEAEDEEINLEDMSEEDLKKFIESVIEDMVEAGELEAGESFEDDVDVDGELDIEDDMETAIDENQQVNKEELDEAMSPEVIAMISAALGVPAVALAGAAAQDAIEKSAEKGNKAAQAVVKAMSAMGVAGKAGGSGIKEAGYDEDMIKEVNALKSELHEVNLLNAKLLYVNKIFRGKNLTENQKVKVLGAFDKATTVAEVKLVFETLNEGLTMKKAAIKENLGSASKPMGTAPKKPILEVNDQFSRWQKLAGIK